MKNDYTEKTRLSPLLAIFFVIFILFSVYTIFSIRNQSLTLSSIVQTTKQYTRPPLYQEHRKKIPELLEELNLQGSYDSAVNYVKQRHTTMEVFLDKLATDQDFAESEYVSSFYKRFTRN